MAEKLFERAEEDRPSLLILGPSGGGKSSLVQAGLIPELEKRFKDHALSPLFSVFDLRSAANKDVHAIAASIRSSWGLLPGLAALAVNSTSDQQTTTPPDAFAALISDLISYLPDQTCFVWILDQLEQFFTLGLSEEADAAFIRFLRELQARGIWIVATFRNDFYSSLRAHDGILSIFGKDGTHDKDGFHDLEKLSETAIERIIQKPAKLAKVEFEYDDQKSELLSLKLKNDALGGGKDILPLLEFALDQLYQKRELKNGRTQMTWAAYKDMGGLQGAVGNRANEVLHSLDESAQEALGRVLRALAKLRRDSMQTEGGKSPFIASAVDAEQFPSGTPARRLVDAFADARLFVRDRDNQGIAQVRVTHEALFTHWPKADVILKGSMKDLVVRERMADSEAHWKTKNEAVSLLLQPGLPLEEAQDLLVRLGDELNPEIIHYIEQSVIADQERKQQESKAQRRKTRFAILTAVVLGILLLIAAGTAYLADQREKELAQTLARSDFNEGVRLVEKGQPREALAYLARAIRFDSKPDSAAARLTASVLLSINIDSARIPHSLIFNSDGGGIVTTSRDKIARIWVVAVDDSLAQPIEHEGVVTSVRFSLDQRLVMTTSRNKTARVWDATTGLPISQPMEHEATIYSAQFSPDGRWIVTASWDKTARVWDAATGKPVSQPMEHGDVVNSAQFSPDGRWVVTTSQDKTARVWDAATGIPVSQPLEHADNIYSAQFSPDGRWVVTASRDKTAQVWDAATGKSVSQPMQHGDAVLSSQFGPDGRWVVTASRDETARVWDAATGKPVSQPIKYQGIIRITQFSPDGLWVATASDKRTIRIWDAATGKPVSHPMEHEGVVNSAQFSPDGRWIVTASWDKSARVWDASTGKPVSQPMQHGDAVLSAQFSPDGRWVVTASDKISQIWDAATGKPVSQPMEHGDVVKSAQFSPDGRWVVTALRNKIALWVVQAGNPVSQPMEHEDIVKSAQFSPDGRWIVTASWDKTARVWDAATGKPVSQPMEHGGVVNSAQFSPNGRWIVTTSQDKTARVWDAATGNPVSRPMQHGNAVFSAQFSPNGRWIVTASWDKSARVWDASTGKPVSQPMQHGDAVLSAQFSPDGHWIVTASDKITQIWDVATAKPVSQPMQHEDIVRSVQFSPDGRYILAKLKTATHIWEIPRLPNIGKGFIEFLERISNSSRDDKNFLLSKHRSLTKLEFQEWIEAANNLTQEEREFINWWLSDPVERTVTPYSQLTVKEHIHKLVDRNTIMSLNEALDYHPGHPMALAKLAAETRRKAKIDQQDDIRPRVALWANLALKYAPDDVAVREVAEKVLVDIAQPN